MSSCNLLEPKCCGDASGETGAVDIADKGAEDNPDNAEKIK